MDASFYIRGLINLRITAKMTATTAGSEKQPGGGALPADRERFCPAVKPVMAWGFGRFVLQGGEDPYFTDERLCTIVSSIRQRFPDCAITLSAGEQKPKATSVSMTQAQTVTCSDMKPLIAAITKASPGVYEL